MREEHTGRGAIALECEEFLEGPRPMMARRVGKNRISTRAAKGRGDALRLPGAPLTGLSR
jgi:hypothetical protein